MAFPSPAIAEKYGEPELLCIGMENGGVEVYFTSISQAQEAEQDEEKDVKDVDDVRDGRANMEKLGMLVGHTNRCATVVGLLSASLV